jgi:hypothetical protein
MSDILPSNIDTHGTPSPEQRQPAAPVAALQAPLTSGGRSILPPTPMAPVAAQPAAQRGLIDAGFGTSTLFFLRECWWGMLLLVGGLLLTITSVAVGGRILWYGAVLFGTLRVGLSVLAWLWRLIRWDWKW